MAQSSHGDNNVFNFSHLVNRSAIMGHVLPSCHPFRQISKHGQLYDRAGKGLWTRDVVTGEGGMALKGLDLMLARNSSL